MYVLFVLLVSCRFHLTLGKKMFNQSPFCWCLEHHHSAGIIHVGKFIKIQFTVICFYKTNVCF